VKRRILFWGIVLGVALMSWGGYLAWRAHNNLVTLDVHYMDVRQVASKIEWQTWERILVHKEVQGKVTLNVHNAPLEEVLNIIAEQTSARWSALYPLYTKGDSLVEFKQVARGDRAVEGSRWTNFYQGRFGGRGGGPGGPGGGMFGENLRNDTRVIDLQLDHKDLTFAALALSRVSQAHVVPENGTAGMISTHLARVPYSKAVASVAKQVNRKWDQFFTLQPNGFGRDFARDGEGGRRDRGDFGGRRFGTNDTNRVDDPAFAESRREQFEAQRQIQFEAQLATMTPEEQKKAKEQQQEMEQLRNMTPEERQQKFQEMMSRPEVQQRMQQRMMGGVMNTTPEQRVERAQRRAQWQQRRTQGR